MSEQINEWVDKPKKQHSSLTSWFPKNHKTLCSSWVISLARSFYLHTQQTLQYFLDSNRYSRVLWCSEIASHPFHSIPIATILIQIQIHITKSCTFTLYSNPSSTMSQVKLPFISLCLHHNSSNGSPLPTQRTASLLWHSKLSTIWHIPTSLLSSATSQHIC